MRKLVYLIAATIDGFIAEPSRADPSGTVFELTGDHAEPLLREYPEMVPHHLRAALGLAGAPNKHFDTVVEGRVSYLGGVAQGVPDAYPHLRHYVFSTTLTEPADPASSWWRATRSRRYASSSVRKGWTSGCVAADRWRAACATRSTRST